MAPAALNTVASFSLASLRMPPLIRPCMRSSCDQVVNSRVFAPRSLASAANASCACMVAAQGAVRVRDALARQPTWPPISCSTTTSKLRVRSASAAFPSRQRSDSVPPGAA